jgi:hypothetical protein
VAEAGSKLADEGRLSRAVDADHEDDRGTRRCEDQMGIVVPRPQRGLDPEPKRFHELVLRLHQALERLTLDVLHQTQRRRNTEVRLEEGLLELLQGAWRDAPAREHGDVHERNVLELLPERPLRSVASLSENPVHHRAITVETIPTGSAQAGSPAHQPLCAK